MQILSRNPLLLYMLCNRVSSQQRTTCIEGEEGRGSRTDNREARRKTRSLSDQDMGLINSLSGYVPPDRGPSELDAVCVMEGLPHGGPSELHSAGVPLFVGARVFATRAL